jgi:hypothetical protein
VTRSKGCEHLIPCQRVSVGGGGGKVMLLMDFGVVGGRVKHILLEREHNFSLSPGTFLLFVHFA